MQTRFFFSRVRSGSGKSKSGFTTLNWGKGEGEGGRGVASLFAKLPFSLC